MEETGLPCENHRLTPSHWQLSHMPDVTPGSGIYEFVNTLFCNFPLITSFDELSRRTRCGYPNGLTKLPHKSGVLVCGNNDYFKEHFKIMFICV